MAELKTKETETSATDFIDSLEDEIKRDDCRKIVGVMEKATGAPPKMWGTNIIGFGNYHYKYESGREGDTFVIGFSPRKSNLTLYFSSGDEWNEDLLAKLGKHKTGKGCLYFKRLSDVDEEVLRQLIEESTNKIEK